MSAAGLHQQYNCCIQEYPHVNVYIVYVNRWCVYVSVIERGGCACGVSVRLFVRL